MVDRLLQYLKESYERLRNRQKGMGDENAGKKGKKGRGGKGKGKGREGRGKKAGVERGASQK